VRVAVVGATGLIGGRLCAALVARGDDAVAVSRGGDAGIEGAVEVRWDPAEGPPPSGVTEGVDAVINMAGASMSVARWTARRKRLIRESRVTTTRLLVDALAAGGSVRTLVSSSGVDYYGPREEPTDESGAPGSSFLAETCVAWEREARRAEDSGLRVVLLRSGIVLSPDGGALPTMARPVRLFAGGPLGGGAQWMPWIHIDDEVGLILFALDHGEIAGPVNAVAPAPVTQREFVTTLARVLGRPALVPTPALALRLALGEMSTLALDSRHAVPAVALAAGYTFAHPDLEGALRAIYG
jgi:uncharacterized protein